MNLCFVTQEGSKVPSGVITVLTRLTEKWDPSTFVTLLTNKNHWAQYLLVKKFMNKSNVKIKQCPWLLPNEFQWFLDYNSFASKIIVRLMTIVCPPFYMCRLAVWLKQNKIEGILSHNGGWPAGELNRWIIVAGKLAGLKHNVLVIHNLPTKPKFSFQFIRFIRDKFIFWCCTDIVTVSDACRKSLIQETGLGRNIKVIYNGIETVFRPESKTKPPWQKKTLSIGFVGELHQRKGIHLFLESLKHVKIPCEVVLIGNGDESYVERLKEIQISSPWPVYFLGFRKDAVDLYEWLDIVVLPSIEFESFGMVLLEAMLWEKPTVCSDFGGMKEVVEHSKTGLVVPANDVKALAAALDILLKKERLRESMGKAGRKRLVEFFSDSVMVKQYETLFQ